MKLRIERKLLEKEYNEDGSEFAEMPLVANELQTTIRVISWNERFFEVTTSTVILEADDVVAMFDGAIEDWEDDELD